MAPPRNRVHARLPGEEREPASGRQHDAHRRLGRSVYFGGIQWATNFSLSPGYITQPIPTIGGQSRAPSTVELYINDALRQTSQVPTGPFTIDNFPQITGSGQARIVVRDLLGRETVLVQDFFSSTSLLRKGLSDYSFEAGAVRRNLGIDSANYGAGFVGPVAPRPDHDFTVETRAEASEKLQRRRRRGSRSRCRSGCSARWPARQAATTSPAAAGRDS